MLLQQIVSGMKNMTIKTPGAEEGPGTNETSEPLDTNGLQSAYEVRYVEEILDNVVKKAEPNQTLEVWLSDFSHMQKEMLNSDT